MKVFYEKDADLAVLAGKTYPMIGYGNQGRAQALNLRDSNLTVIVGNIDDHTRKPAIKDGFPPLSDRGSSSRRRYRDDPDPG